MNPRSLIIKSASLLLVAIVVAATARATEKATAKSPPAADSKSGIELVEPPPLPPEIAALATTNATALVEHRIAAINQAEITSTRKAQALLLMLPTLEKDGQRKAAHAVTKNVVDKDYLLIRRQLLDPKLPSLVLSAFMTDTLKRQNRLKIPALLDLARVERHPLEAEAKQLLGVYLGKDHGTNWVKWEETVVAWLKQNTD